MTRTGSSTAKALAHVQPETIPAPRRLLLAAMLAATTSFAMACSAFTGPRAYGSAPVLSSNPPPRRGAARS
ncbi:hypothetical protein SAMN04515666_103359 [Bosea lupini]|uniref:Uncharacterized protein n=1 Tax=Bosea lupini TaxID=1036779 RepID=A0A1H7P3I8_9HYPH|nr:hypothetical protein [Bosea lupini]SEL30381.1 hypothetical protein SAMN04515666_103359 [Bosea lupini]